MAEGTRNRMIETTARLLQHRGYYGTALSDILEASGAPRGSLYFHFPGGKDQLVLEATQAAAARATRELDETMAAAKSPGRGVRAYVEAAARIMRETDYSFGCPVAPVILDAAGGQDALSRLCRETFESWRAILQASFRAAGIPKPRAASLAILAISAIEGALVMARAYRDCEALHAVGADLEAVVDAALPRRRR